MKLRAGSQMPLADHAGNIPGIFKVIGIATDEKPFDIHVSYTTEKGRELTPVPSEGSDSS